jgi:hypothetical protein
MSPTVMIQNYLKARGYQPTSENISRALAANQQDPGVIPGLRSDTPGVNPPVGAGGGRGAVTGGGTPQNAINTSVAQGDTAPGSGDPTTSAAPPDNSSLTGILSGLGVGGLAGLAQRILGGGRPPLPGAGAPAMTDVGGGVAQLGGPEARLALPAPPLRLAAPATPADTRLPSPMQQPPAVIQQPAPTDQGVSSALDKAVPPDAPAPAKKPRVRVKARTIVR